MEKFKTKGRKLIYEAKVSSVKLHNGKKKKRGSHKNDITHPLLTPTQCIEKCEGLGERIDVKTNGNSA